MTERYQALCAHYGMTASRNNRGVAHENGSSPRWPRRPSQAHHRRRAGATRIGRVRRSRHLRAPSSNEIVGRASPTGPSPSTAERALQQDLPAMRAADYEESKVGHLVLRLHPKPCCYRPSRLIGHVSGAPLRCRLDSSSAAPGTLTPAARAAEQDGHPCARRQLPPRHPFLEEEADGAAESGLPRRPVPPATYRRCSRRWPGAVATPSARPAKARGNCLLTLAHEEDCEAALAAEIDRSWRGAATRPQRPVRPWSA